MKNEIEQLFKLLTEIDRNCDRIGQKLALLIIPSTEPGFIWSLIIGPENDLGWISNSMKIFSMGKNQNVEGQ